MILNDEILRKLELLSIRTRKTILGQYSGERKSPKKGAGVEFADFRSYSPGDDIRRIDWNTYARTESLFLKLFAEELELPLNIVIDSSASMGFGTPPKFEFARQVAEALSYVAFCNLDRVRLISLGEQLLSTNFHSTKTSLPLFDSFLSGIQPAGSSGERAFRTLAQMLSRKQVVMFLTDLLWNDGYQRQIGWVSGTGAQIGIVHVLSPEEVDPELYGDFKLVDSETKQAVEISVGQHSLKKYKQDVKHFIDLAQSYSISHGCAHCFAQSDAVLEEFLLGKLRAAGFLE